MTVRFINLHGWHAGVSSSEDPFFWYDVSGAWRYGSHEEEMERHFFVEAKNFVFSVLERELVVCLEKKRRGYAGSVTLGAQCITGWSR